MFLPGVSLLIKQNVRPGVRALPVPNLVGDISRAGSVSDGPLPLNASSIPAVAYAPARTSSFPSQGVACRSENIGEGEYVLRVHLLFPAVEREVHTEAKFSGVRQYVAEPRQQLQESPPIPL